MGLVDFGIDDGAPYLVMEFVEGKTLADLLDHGAVKPERAVAIVRQILAGLEHAHDRGILHRDLKPANVMIVEIEGFRGDFVKILDFGLAKLAWPGEDKRDVTVEGIAIGTPGYMSPEQAAGIPSDRRSDIYCTGALLYHLVTGSKAFEGDDVRSVLRRHREETPQSPREIKPSAGISRPLEDIIERAMERDPAKRYQSAKDMVVALVATPEAKKGPPDSAGAMPPAIPPTPTPTPNGDSTKAEAPSARARMRKSSSRLAWGAMGLVGGVVVSVAAVMYSPLGELVRPRSSDAHAAVDHANDPVAAEPDHRAADKSGDKAGDKIAAADLALVVLPSGSAIAPSGATVAAPGVTSAADAAPAPDAGPSAASNEDEDDDTPASKADDGSNEDDRQPPPEPAAAPRREASQVKSLNDVRSLVRKGDSDTALVGLYRLRRNHPSASKASEISVQIGNNYFGRKWWTDALREYRFAITLDGRAKKNEVLVINSVHALSERATYARARRLILDYVGKSAVSALKRAVKTGPTPTLRRRAQKVLATLESKSYRAHK